MFRICKSQYSVPWETWEMWFQTGPLAGQPIVPSAWHKSNTAQGGKSGWEQESSSEEQGLVWYEERAGGFFSGSCKLLGRQRNPIWKRTWDKSKLRGGLYRTESLNLDLKESVPPSGTSHYFTFTEIKFCAASQASVSCWAELFLSLLSNGKECYEKGEKVAVGLPHPYHLSYPTKLTILGYGFLNTNDTNPLCGWCIIWLKYLLARIPKARQFLKKWFSWILV